MRSMIGSMAQQFETFLFHRGEETGSIRGWMKVRVPKDTCGTREKLYGKGGRTPVPSCHPGRGGTVHPRAAHAQAALLDPSSGQGLCSAWWGDARLGCSCRVDQL